MSELLLITLNGNDRPGVTSALTTILSQHQARILDIGQAVIHDTLTLGVLAEVSEAEVTSPMLKDILFRAHELNMQVRFEPISRESYIEWVSHKGKARHIVTLLARKLTAEHIAQVTAVAVAHSLNIDNINRLSGRAELDKAENEGVASNDARSGDSSNIACVEFSARGNSTDLQKLRRDFMKLATEFDIDIAIQEDNRFRRNRRLVCFDMDSTLIETEVIDELAEKAGVGDRVREITESAMTGKIDFKQSFASRLSLLKGLDESVLASVADNLPLTEGAERLIKNLKEMGYKTAILSGGFTYFAKNLQQRLGIDYTYANELEIKDGRLTGKVVGEVVDGERKAELVKLLAEKENINLEQVIAVGDGANDLPMLSLAGLGIAFRAKPLVKASSNYAISALGLDAILYLLGFRESDMKEML